MSIAMERPESGQLREVARRFLEERGPGAAGGEDQTSVAAEALWPQLVAMGWDRMLAPDELGGADGRAVDACAVIEETGRALAPAPLLGTILAGAALRSVSHLPMGSWTRRFEERFPILVLEGSAGTFPRPPVSLRRSADDGWRAEGAGLFSPEAPGGDLLLLPGLRDDGEAIVIVEPTQVGVEIEMLDAFDGTRPLCGVRLDDVRLEPDDVIVVPRGESFIDELVDWAALLVAAESLGVARACLEAAVEYAGVRTQFGSPIGAFQAVQHPLADLAVRIEQAASLVGHAATTLDAGHATRSETASMAKMLATSAARDAAAIAIQVHGGIGFTWERGLHQYLRRAKANQVSFGDPDWHADRVASLSGWRH